MIKDHNLNNFKLVQVLAFSPLKIKLSEAKHKQTKSRDLTPRVAAHASILTNLSSFSVLSQPLQKKCCRNKY